jgi:hypothetical protein
MLFNRDVAEMQIIYANFFFRRKAAALLHSLREDRTKAGRAQVTEGKRNEHTHHHLNRTTEGEEGITWSTSRPYPINKDTDGLQLSSSSNQRGRRQVRWLSGRHQSTPLEEREQH